MHSIDFLRNCFVYTPDQEDSAHAPFLISSQTGNKNRVFCKCSKGSYANCPPAKKLLELHSRLIETCNGASPQDLFQKSIFWKSFEPITKFSTLSCGQIKHETHGNILHLKDNFDKNIAFCHGSPEERRRLLSRIGQNTKDSIFYRLAKAVVFVYSDTEKVMIALGHKTQYQAVEESIWYRLAYHCFREYSSAPINIEYEIDPDLGQFFIELYSQTNILMKVSVPPRAVHNVIIAFSGFNIPGKKPRIQPGETELMFDITDDNNERIACIPVIRDPSTADSKPEKLSDQVLFDSLIYITKTGNIFRLSSQSTGLLATGWGKEKTIERDDVSSFLEKNEQSFMLEDGHSTDNAAQVIDLFSSTGGIPFGRLAGPRIIDQFDRVEITPVLLDDKRCIMSISYCNGSFTIPLKKIIQARREKARFIYDTDCIVDCASKGILAAIVNSRNADSDGNVELSRAALLQFRGTTLSAKITGEKKLVAKINQMLEFKPLRDLQPFHSFNCNLREYQRIGVQWLLFLYDNHFGGLLCDEMGLGKTVQITAYILALKEQRNCMGPSLVVCPATVLPHWNRVVNTFAPDLKIKVYYNSGRVDAVGGDYDILLTTYGILRNDINELCSIFFELAVFDEIHQLKNSATETFKAAVQINANTRIGLTGTPIENSIVDLKNLFDLTMPGLFNHDVESDERMLSLLENDESDAHLQRIQRLISPFILRRSKKMVLTDLPSKIEDIRTCEMTDQQRAIYYEAMVNRGGPLIQSLKNSKEPVPYMKIFALLSFLKQVCDHPALAAGHPEDFESHECGKWELFKELLDEALESGQKVVVFTQFLDMVEIFRLYFEQRNIGHCILTGASRNRGEIIKRFETDDSRKVFIGSLKAGGVGIDLVAASVVIHYDRWWNASKEDQATDRVHRIGQKKCVQVFKLVTEDSIEERIGSIIDRKKKLSEAALTEDDPEEMKIFSREELLEIIENH